TIITFLMVFLIQSTQNRDSAALHLKLDEVIRALKGARNSLLDLEELTEDELEAFRKHYEKLAQRARIKRGQTQTPHPPESTPSPGNSPDQEKQAHVKNGSSDRR